jgi:two-component system osmolarity sensor histidine kinase EnvZ
MVLVSGLVTRRLTRPLERLRQRLAWGPPPDTVQNESYLDLPLDRATPDVEDIDRAWRDVQTQLARHGRERAFLLAGLSHDLRHPLARIKLTAELLPSSPELISKRAVILRNAEVAERMVASFLDHARSGGLPIDQTVDVAAVARRIADERPRSTEALHVDMPATLRLPRSHPVLIDRLLTLLVENAYAHGRPPVELRGRDHLGNVMIEVIDSGPPATSDEREEREQSLIAFAAGENIINLPHIGLGLAVAREVVTRMRGRIEFERGVGRHIVRVRLPARRALPPLRPTRSAHDDAEELGETLPPGSMF